MLNTDTVVLLRATSVQERERAFADDLAKSSSTVVAFLVDGRRGPPPLENRPVVALDDASIRNLRLPLIDFYPWRCGDYGLYLARHRFPDARFFWLIEADVRFSVSPATDFFAAMAASEADLLVTGFRPAEPSWFWGTRGQGRGVTPHRCLYSVARFSASLIDAMLAKRQAHARSFLRRSFWGNDEVFTATTAAHGSFQVTDINAIQGPWYFAETFEYGVTINGAALPGSRTRPELLHSVRFGDQVGTRKAHPPIDAAWHFKGRRKLARLVTPYLPW